MNNAWSKNHISLMLKSNELILHGNLQEVEPKSLTSRKQKII
jgi:hypothetical protein